MSKGIYVALSGALAHQTTLESVATNLANASTLGYRSVVPAFREVLGRTGGPARDAPRFSAVRRTGIDTTEAPRETTERPLDAALGRSSFLAVQTPAGERYTRAVSLEVASDGTLRTRSGFPVLTEAATPLVLEPGSAPSLSETGEVAVGGQVVGRLRVVSFQNPGDMSYEGAYLLAPGPSAGRPDISAEPLVVGSLELSNTSPVRAMTDLMLATRMSEAMDRAIGAFREADQRVASTVPK
ncbi:MAG: flagellar hook basal-body protein [Myxococcales bacterium]|nr:flagellar hook basal-body protein [Myxococcales bacterium]